MICSCASLFAIGSNEDSHWLLSQEITMQNVHFHTLIQGFARHQSHKLCLEDVRNTVRNGLHLQNNHAFPMGVEGLDLRDLFNAMFECSPPASIGREMTHCDNCALHNTTSVNISNITYVFFPDVW